MILPGGYSPVQSFKQNLDNINPFNGATDYDQFSQLGKQQSGQVQGASTGSPYNGSTYYDAASGRMMEWRDGSYQPASGGDANDNPTTSIYNTGNGQNTPKQPAYSQEDMQYLDSQQSLYERLMQSINSAEASGLKRLQDSETSAKNSANTQRGRALEDFGIQRQDSERGQTSALNRVGDNSRTLRNSLMRQLGLGSSGGSAFMVADNAVARDASKNRAGVQESFGTNFRNLGTAEKRAEEDYNTLLEEIKNDRLAKEESFRGGIIGQRQANQQSLAEIASERARLQGGNPLQASAGYRNNYLGLQDQVDRLPSQFDTNVSARALKVETPQLRDYIVDRASIGGGQSKQTQYSPYKQFLQKDDEEQVIA